MPIQLNTTIEKPAEVFDKVWINNIQIISPSPLQKIRAFITVCPMSASGSLDLTNSKIITVDDVDELAGTDTNVATAMGSIFAFVQSEITNKNLFN